MSYNGQRYIPLKLVFNIKQDGRYRARLVALGYRQVQGIDYEDIHAPVISDVGFRMIVNISIQNGWKLVKLDVESAFLLGKLNEEIFIEITDGFKEKGRIGRLNSELYGLVQASRVFYQTMKNFLVDELNFEVCTADGCILM